MKTLISKSEFAKKHEVSIRTVDRWINDGLAVAVIRGKQSLVDSEKSERLLKANHRRAGRPKASDHNGEFEPGTRAYLKRQNLTMDVRLLRLKVDERMSKLIDIDEAAAVITEECAFIRSTCRKLGSNVARRLASVEAHTPQRIKAVIDAEVNALLTILSKED